MRIKATNKVLGGWQPKFKKKMQSSTHIAAACLNPDVSYQLQWSSALPHLKGFSIHAMQIISNRIFDWSVYIHKAT